MKNFYSFTLLLQFAGAVFMTTLAVVMFGCQLYIAGKWLPWMWLSIVIIALLVSMCRITWKEYKEESNK